MNGYLEVIKKLDELNIPYNIVEHPPALTTELADKFIEGHEGVRSKTMFLTNRRKTEYYLVIMDESKMLDMNKFREITNANKIRMASSDSLLEKMGLAPGVVSPFGLLNNTEKDVNVYIDKDVLSEKIITFHPNTNEKTMFINTCDLPKFLNDIGYEMNIIDL